MVKTTRNFHLDHIDPKSKQGANQIMNRAPLCPHHNIRKNSRRVHLEDRRAKIDDAVEMMVDTTGELIDLAWMYEQELGYSTMKLRRCFIMVGQETDIYGQDGEEKCYDKSAWDMSDMGSRLQVVGVA